MSNRLTNFEIEILKALRKHNDRNTAEQFSMDEYYKNLQEDVKLNRFREILELLENGGYIKRICITFKEEFGFYNITPEGLRYLINLERKT
jgi:hypothetical protein